MEVLTGVTKEEFDRWLADHGKAILQFCRMTTGSIQEGDELYQDTMLKLTQQREKLDMEGNIKSYALSISILLWKNKCRKFAWRKRLAPFESLEAHMEQGSQGLSLEAADGNPEQEVLQAELVAQVRQAVRELPEKYRIVIYLHYSGQLKLREIADCLKVPENTVKSRMRKAKQLLKKKLEVVEYDR